MIVRVIGVPSAWGIDRLGVEETPARLRAAGLLDDLRRGGLDVVDGGDVEVPPGRASKPPDAGPEPDELPHLDEVTAVCTAVRAATDEALDAGQLPLLVGGECSLAIGVVASLAARYSPLRIAWLDAHGDFNLPDTSPSGLLTGMPLATILGRGHPRLLEVAGDAPRPRGRHTWLLGCRNVDAGEERALEEAAVQRLGVHRLREIGAEEVAATVLGVTPEELVPGTGGESAADGEPGAGTGDRLYLHLDVDVLDAGIASGATYPEPDGLRVDEVADLAGYLCASGRMGALTLASVDLRGSRPKAVVGTLRWILTSIGDALATAGELRAGGGAGG